MIVLTGVAGSGKSVQGKLLAQDLGYRWLSTGEFLRQRVDGKRREEMLQGKLLADEEIIDILDKFFDEEGSDSASILDGFPRTITQAEWLIAQHEAGRIRLTAVLHLEASEEVVKARLLSRGRQDDTEKVIQWRFSEYRNVTLPIVGWFRDKQIPVYEIDSERTVEEVHKDIMDKLKG